ncbi:MAG: virulence factor, partial [bacterium]
CGDDLQAIADKAAAELEQAYDRDRLLALIKNEGNEPS